MRIKFTSTIFSVNKNDLKIIKDKPVDKKGSVLMSDEETKIFVESLKENASVIVLSAPKLEVLCGQQARFAIIREDHIQMKKVELEVRPVRITDHRYITFDANSLVRDDTKSLQAKQVVTLPEGSSTILRLGTLLKKNDEMNIFVLIQANLVKTGEK